MSSVAVFYFFSSRSSGYLDSIQFVRYDTTAFLLLGNWIVDRGTSVLAPSLGNYACVYVEGIRVECYAWWKDDE